MWTSRRTAQRFVSSVCILLLLWTPVPDARAFGLRTHLWIGQQILDELGAFCRVEIAGMPAAINSDVCASLRKHPQAFLAGVLGPDAYPDLITGQVTTHPGIEGDWLTADWLRHVYADQQSGASLAFGAGYLVHAASDVFAHTYVNAYSGDVFILSDERAVERRHFVLEKYIDSKLPPFNLSGGTASPPAGFVRDKLLHDSGAGRQAAKSGVALHTASMSGIYRNVNDLADQLDQIERDAAKALTGVLGDIAKLDIQLQTQEPQLKALRETLSAKEEEARIKNEALDAAKKAHDKAQSELKNGLDLINGKQAEATAAEAAANAAKQAAAAAVSTISSLQQQLGTMRTNLANTVRMETVSVCKTVTKSVCSWVSVGGLIPGLKEVCEDKSEQACDNVERVTAAYADLEKQISNAEASLAAAQNQAAQAAATEVAETARKAVALHAKIEQEKLQGALDATAKAAKLAYNTARAQFDIEEAAATEAKAKVDALEAELKKIRDQLDVSKSVRDALTDLIANADIVSGYAKNWVRGMDTAGTQFVQASHKIVMGLMQGKSEFATTYLDWWRCYGVAYTPVPAQFGQATCAFQNFLDHIHSEIDKITAKILPPPFNQLFERYLALKVQIKGELRVRVNEAALHFAKLVAPDPTTADFIELLARPEQATRAKLDEVFATTEGAKGKALLTFDGVADWVDADIGLKGDRLDPERFRALKNALTLSKLALIDASTVKKVVWVLGGDPALVSAPTGSGRYSILFSMVRSIDGNHQWQPFGLPYPRSDGVPRPAADDRHYGFGPRDGSPTGLDLFIDPGLRRLVFNRLFHGPISGRLAEHPAMTSYPFKECAANPFPVAFKEADGDAADIDSGCDGQAVGTGGGTAYEWWRRTLNWLGLAPG